MTPTKANFWTADEDEALRQRTLAGDAACDIAADTGRTQRAVHHRRRYLGIAGKAGRPRKTTVASPAVVSDTDTASMRITSKSIASDIAALEGQLADLQETLGLVYALQRKLDGENVSLRAVRMARPDAGQDRQTARLRALKFLRENAA